MSDLKYVLPKTLDDPIKVFLWDIDYVIVALFPAGVGMLAEQILLGLAGSFLLGWSYARVRAGKHPAFLKHFLYWKLPSTLGLGLRAKRLSPSSQREFIG